MEIHTRFPNLIELIYGENNKDAVGLELKQAFYNAAAKRFQDNNPDISVDEYIGMSEQKFGQLRTGSSDEQKLYISMKANRDAINKYRSGRLKSLAQDLEGLQKKPKSEIRKLPSSLKHLDV